MQRKKSSAPVKEEVSFLGPAMASDGEDQCCWEKEKTSATATPPRHTANAVTETRRRMTMLLVER